MDVLYERGEASVGEVRRALPNAPSYSAVRALMRKLLDKGHASYREEGTRYVYRPVLTRNRARRSALQRVVNTFYDGSAADAVVGLLGNERNLTDEDLARIQATIEKLKAPKS